MGCCSVGTSVRGYRTVYYVLGEKLGLNIKLLI